MSFESLRDEIRRADAAYALAVRSAKETGDWGLVAPAGHASKQAKAALKAAEGDR
jgi:hypothetical protein